MKRGERVVDVQPDRTAQAFKFSQKLQRHTYTWIDPAMSNRIFMATSGCRRTVSPRLAAETALYALICLDITQNRKESRRDVLASVG